MPTEKSGPGNVTRGNKTMQGKCPAPNNAAS